MLRTIQLRSSIRRVVCVYGGLLHAGLDSNPESHGIAEDHRQSTNATGEGSNLTSIEPSLKPEIASRAHVTPGSHTSLSRLEEAVVQAVAYSDIFDYPLTAREIHRYLMDMPASYDEINQVLSNGRLATYLTSSDGYYTLAGRAGIVETRRRRCALARSAWSDAFRYGRIIASLPFVRMVAVTGELAMDNVGPASDIDYFIVTDPGRLWLSRLMVIGVVRFAALRGLEICPNYLISERALELDDRNLYTAHEVAQMVPIAGLTTFRRFFDLNPWVQDYLPNATGPHRFADAPLHGRPFRKLTERALRTWAGARLERWEMVRKIRKFSGGDQDLPETAYSPDRCKGHVDGHGERILALFNERWQSVRALMQ